MADAGREWENPNREPLFLNPPPPLRLPFIFSHLSTSWHGGPSVFHGRVHTDRRDRAASRVVHSHTARTRSRVPHIAPQGALHRHGTRAVRRCRSAPRVIAPRASGYVGGICLGRNITCDGADAARRERSPASRWRVDEPNPRQPVRRRQRRGKEFAAERACVRAVRGLWVRIFAYFGGSPKQPTTTERYYECTYACVPYRFQSAHTRASATQTERHHHVWTP